MEHAVLTLSPDNALTVGLMLAILYVAALLVVQVAMKSGALKPKTKAAGQG